MARRRPVLLFEVDRAASFQRFRGMTRQSGATVFCGGRINAASRSINHYFRPADAVFRRKAVATTFQSA
jgi:hypothetical protein